MTDFNALPLDEKKKQAQAGDIVVTDRGARLPFIHADKLVVTVALEGHRNYPLDIEFITDIIRPTERKVPEVVEIVEIVEWLRERAHMANDYSTLNALFKKLADHFERTP